jgi:glycolate oxidase FAD binding subunit
VSLKVLPRPVAETTLRFAMSETDAIGRLNDWGGQPLPISASVWCDGTLSLRLSGADAAVRSAARKLGGETVAAGDADAFWAGLREQTDGFFQVTGESPANGVLWRVSLPSAAAPLKLAGAQWIEWGGALRWLRSDLPADTIRERAAALGGHATLFRAPDRSGEVFQPLSAPLMALHRRLKDAFDPAGILNPGRLYSGF